MKMERLRKSFSGIGMMSGTSCDGVDFAQGSFHLDEAPRLKTSLTLPYPRSIQKKLQHLAQNPRVAVAELVQIHYELGRLYADLFLQFLKKKNLSAADIDFISLHGQTIFHAGRLAPRKRMTYQIGEPSFLVAATGLTTIADFRPSDIAAQGEGAPLTPLFHHTLFRHPLRGIAFQNIGGIGNITYIPPRATIDDVIGFDTGPGNSLIDEAIFWASQGKKRVDEGGEWAKRGKPDLSLVEKWLKHPFLAKNPPKSTGKEEFGAVYFQHCLADFKKGKKREDVVATFVAFTAYSIVRAIEKFIVPSGPLDEVIIGGGGVKNKTLIHSLRTLLPQVKWFLCEEKGFPSQSIEALAFAYLGFRSLCSLPGNLPQVTAARTSIILGKILPGKNFWELMQRMYGYRSTQSVAGRSAPLSRGIAVKQ